jgi:hypothetical protein
MKPKSTVIWVLILAAAFTVGFGLTRLITNQINAPTQQSPAPTEAERVMTTEAVEVS